MELLEGGTLNPNSGIETPTELIRFQDGAAQLPLEQRPTMTDWLARFNAGLKEAA